MRRAAIDLKKAGEAVTQVVDGGRIVGTAVATAPLIEKQPIAFVFLEGRGIEDAQNIVLNAHRFNLIDAFTGSTPVERIDILQHGQDFGVRHLLAQSARQMLRGKVRFAKEDKDCRSRMALADFGEFRGSMAIAGSNLSEIFPRHAVEAVDALAVI